MAHTICSWGSLRDPELRLSWIIQAHLGVNHKHPHESEVVGNSEDSREVGRWSQLGLKKQGTECSGTDEKARKWFSAKASSLRFNPACPDHGPDFRLVKLIECFWLPQQCKINLSSFKSSNACEFVAAARRTKYSHLSPGQGKHDDPERSGEMLSVCEGPEQEWHLPLSPATWRPLWFQLEAPLTKAAFLSVCLDTPPSRLCVYHSSARNTTSYLVRNSHMWSPGGRGYIFFLLINTYGAPAT